MANTATISKLNNILADANVMHTKLHNYHWNVKGMQFYGLHAKTEEFYGTFATIYDDVAERILQLGGKPLVTLKQILATARIKEDERTDFSANDVVKALMEDFKFFHGEFKSLSDGADAITTAYADEKVGMLEKEIWMLRSMLGE
ncbi:MAG: DNA starvation/stationary phase protection protein [Halobacteriovorax sp.]|nr:DNA starvation/stationary phase protection protein [Halobacteriovorax sp.]